MDEMEKSYVNLENLCAPPESSDPVADDIQCDGKDNVLCPENDTVLTCLNGGVCALFPSEVGEKCVRRCQCAAGYTGPRCEFYTGILSAKMTITVACLLAFIFLVFLVVIIWYCCSRKSQRNTPDMTQDDTRSSPRVSITNRLAKPPKAERTGRAGKRPINQSGQSINPLFADLDVVNAEVRNDFTSRSYSIYDNVQLDETECFIDDDADQIMQGDILEMAHETDRLLDVEQDRRLSGPTYEQAASDEPNATDE